MRRERGQVVQQNMCAPFRTVITFGENTPKSTWALETKHKYGVSRKVMGWLKLYYGKQGACHLVSKLISESVLMFCLLTVGMERYGISQFSEVFGVESNERYFMSLNTTNHNEGNKANMKIIYNHIYELP